MAHSIEEHLAFLYGASRAPAIQADLQRRLRQWQEALEETTAAVDSTTPRLTEQDAVLITYGDMVRAGDAPPLRTLADFLAEHVAGLISTIHLLPFYPYSSDDGFAVVDYRAVDPALGAWEDVALMGERFRLMFDAVINHISAQSGWFQAFLRNEAPYRDYFKVVEPDTDLSQVFRPRALPLLTPFQTSAGEKLVWTTFSEDQVDLNYENPEVLLDVIDTILFYVARGADLLRLDAIAFMWKEAGTRSIHLPQTHRIIQLLRAVLDEVAPHVVLVTETNVPHEENVSYFGDGYNEAQMVYNFSLPPLTLHAFHSGSAAILSRWAATLQTPSDYTTFFNFLASHDGIGLTPAKGILSDEAIAAMVERVQASGGYVSYRSTPEGPRSAYELNANFLDALADPRQPQETIELEARRFLASQAIMLALQGVPGIYFHSLFGSRSWQGGVRQTGRQRTINRQKLQRADLEAALRAPGALRHRVFTGYSRLLRQRAAHAAFHPQAPQRVLSVHEALFALWRTSYDGRSHLLCLHNVSNRLVRATLDRAQMPAASAFRDLLSDARFVPRQGRLSLTLAPYQVLWLAPAAEPGQ